MSALRNAVETIVGGVKGDSSYQLSAELSERQLAAVLWHRGWQWLRGIPLRMFAPSVHGPVFRGRRVVVEQAAQLTSGPGLILEDGVFLSALSRDGIHLGRNVTIARNAILQCTGVLAELGVGIRIGDRSAVGAGAFLGGQGGIHIGDDVIMGPGIRIFSENHRTGATDRPIRAQGVHRKGVRIESDCWIGGGATILDGVMIGAGSVVAAGAVVTGDVAPLSVVAGVPARVLSSRGPRPGGSAHPAAQ